MSTRRGPRLDSRTLFLAGGLFALLVAALGAWIALGARESRRILDTGKRTRAVVLSKEVDARKRNHWIEVRPEEPAGTGPFRRVLRPGDWDGVAVGDRLGYVYEPEWPAHGVLDLELGMRTDVGGWFFLGSFFVWPFLLAGAVLKVRERRRAAAA